MTRPSAAELAAWRAFLEAHQAVMRNLEREHERELDLPLTWYDVLFQLSEAEGGRRRMTDLADAVLLSRSGLTRLVDRMQDEELVRREVCETDRRGYFAVLTAAGRAALASAAPTHLQGIADYFTDHLDDEEVAVLTRALRRVRAANRDDAGDGDSG